MFEVLESEMHKKDEELEIIRNEKRSVILLEKYHPDYYLGRIDAPIIGNVNMTKAVLYFTAGEESTIFYILKEFDRYKVKEANVLLE